MHPCAKPAIPHAAGNSVFRAGLQSNKVYPPRLSLLTWAGIVVRRINAIRWVSMTITNIANLAAFVACITPAAAIAGQCEAIAAMLIQTENLAFVRKSPSGQNTFLSGPLMSELSVSCSEASPSIFFATEAAFPSKAFFAFASRAGSIASGRPAKSILKLLNECHQAALKDSSELATAKTGPLLVECQAFTRDGGGTAFSVYGGPQ